MIKYITIFIVLLITKFIHSQHNFGISRAQLVNEIGVPDSIEGTSNEIYEYQIADYKTLDYTVKRYFFNDYDELKEVLILYIYNDCSQAKRKLNQLLSLANNKYSKSAMMSGNNKMMFVNPNSPKKEGKTIVLQPRKLGSSCFAEERDFSTTYF
tara:strand:+ start:64 stop:525 length:462 start_codon:yes stop_codon:yes gene_type:complete